MKTSDAMKIILRSEKHKKTVFTKSKGFMVSFEKRDGGVLCSDHFPDKHKKEPLIKTEKEAWSLAKRFANATDNTYVNIYVVNHEFRPVENYKDKEFKHLHPNL